MCHDVMHLHISLFAGFSNGSVYIDPPPVSSKYEANRSSASRISRVETPFFRLRFVSGHEENRLATGVEGKGDPPYPAVGTETKLLHVAMTRPVQRVHSRATERWSELLDKPGRGIELLLDRVSQVLELLVKGWMKSDNPAQACNMMLRAYAVKRISMWTAESVIGLDPISGANLDPSPQAPTIGTHEQAI